MDFEKLNWKLLKRQKNCELTRTLYYSVLFFINLCTYFRPVQIDLTIKTIYKMYSQTALDREENTSILFQEIKC